MQHDLCNGWGVEWRRLVSLVWHFGQQYRTWLVGQTSFLRLHLQLLVHGVHCRRPYDSHRQTSSKSRRSGPSCWLPKSLRGQGPANSAAAGSRIDDPPLAAAGPGDGEKNHLRLQVSPQLLDHPVGHWKVQDAGRPWWRQESGRW